MGIEPIPSPLQYNSNEMISMPYKHCQKVMEDGHRCNEQFYVPTNLHTLKFCPEQESPKGDLEVLLNEETAVKTINKAKTDLESLKAELETHRKEIDTYFDKMTMEIRKVEKENAIGDSDFAKLQRQITTLGNRVRKLQE